LKPPVHPPRACIRKLLGGHFAELTTIFIDSA
jgi:hypothetical protein